MNHEVNEAPIEASGNKSKVISVRIWRTANQKESITVQTGSKITSVNNDRLSKRGNPSLYAILEEMLEADND